MEIEKENYLQRPRPMKASSSIRNRNKFCQFHRDHGHNTEECIQLRDAIEDLIKRGYLGRYIDRQGPRSEATVPQPPPEEAELPNQRPTNGGVGMIHRPTNWRRDEDEASK